MSINYSQAMNLPKADIIVDIEKGFLLEYVGSYSPEYEKVILHTFVPLRDFCLNTPTTDICMRTSQLKNRNMLELSTISSTRNTILSNFQRRINDISNLINADISKILSNHHSGEFFTNIKSNFHYFDNNFYVNDKTSQLDQVNSNHNDVTNLITQQHRFKTSASIVLEQIMRNQIGFKFLSDEEIMLFLSPLMSSIDKSYTYLDMKELLNAFTTNVYN